MTLRTNDVGSQERMRASSSSWCKLRISFKLRTSLPHSSERGEESFWKANLDKSGFKMSQVGQKLLMHSKSKTQIN